VLAVVAVAAILALLARASFGAEPAALYDPAEGATPLDLCGARFGQARNGDLTLSIRTHQPWQPGDIAPPKGRRLCLWLRSDQAPAADGRLCVVPDPGAPSGLRLRYTVLDAAGSRIGIREIETVLRRPRPTTISARFAPTLLRLVPGLYHWQVRSLYDGVEDQLPDGAEVSQQIAPATAPAARERCFGAASRDPRHRCVNPRLRLAVVPSPDDAVISQNAPCMPMDVDGVLKPCAFGLPAAGARATVALVGDSHASHWRGALEIAARDAGWRGVSITRSGCPLSEAPAKLEPESRRTACLSWNAQVPQWFARHPQVHTVFVVQHFAAQVLVPGRDVTAAKVAGYAAAWKALPASVTRIVVIRDTPLVGYDALQCVRRAQASHRDAGRACAVPRGATLGSDAAVVAALRLRSRRVGVVDMSPFLCSRRRCFPVVGGALVYKDDQHLTDTFATTLGPYLLRAFDAIQRRPKSSASVAPEPPMPAIGAPRARPTPTSR
jgi:hypothetical protein